VDAHDGGAMGGGLVGYNDDYHRTPTVVRSYSTGPVTSDHGNAGGLVGVNDGTILLSRSQSQSLAGLVATNGGTISQSYATGPRGLVGTNEGTVIQCYAIGPQTYDYGQGGFVEANYGQISQSYSTGHVPATDTNGGFAGFDYPQYHATITSSYWDTDT